MIAWHKCLLYLEWTSFGNNITLVQREQRFFAPMEMRIETLHIYIAIGICSSILYPKMKEELICIFTKVVKIFAHISKAHLGGGYCIGIKIALLNISVVISRGSSLKYFVRNVPLTKIMGRPDL